MTRWARRAPALQPFPAERAAIRNRPRGEKSCITLLCQESHLTTSMDAQGSKAQRPCEFLKIFGKVPTFYGFSRLLWSRASRRDERIIQILSPQLSGTSDQTLGAILQPDISPRPGTARSTWAEYSGTLDVQCIKIQMSPFPRCAMCIHSHKSFGPKRDKQFPVGHLNIS